MFWAKVTTSSDPSQLSLASLLLSRAGSCHRDLLITIVDLPLNPIRLGSISLLEYQPGHWQ